MIIKSLLDNDLYKFTMSQYLWKTRKDMGDNDLAEFSFKNRTDVKLLNIISLYEINTEVKSLVKLSLSFSELSYLANIEGIDKDYVDALSTALPSTSVDIRIHEISSGRLMIKITGPWWLATLYETPCLATINELYNRTVNKNLITGVQEEAIERKFTTKVQWLELNKEIRFIEFGTRRRYSHEIQDMVIYNLQCIPHAPMLGTSNVYFARKYNLLPIGTMAHEIPMGMAGIQSGRGSRELRLSQTEIMDKWLSMYPKTYWLTDTYGSKWLIENAKEIISKNEFLGLRQDSGDPIAWIDLVHIHFGTRKSLMFSDGLTPKKMKKIYEHCRALGFTSYDINFGWGTNLTNDGVIKPLSIVIKLTGILDASGKMRPTVKLSDNPNKATGPKECIEIYKSAFNYDKNITKEEKCVY